MQVEYLPVDKIKPYTRNARKHQDVDVSAIMNSIKAFGFNDPIGIWSDENIIVEGHGRLEAAKKLGMDTVPCIRLDNLTDGQRRAYALAHNKTAELSEWDDELLDIELDELDELDDINMSDFGFDDDGDWFTNRERNDTTREEGNREYNEFLDKFEPKKTTDDCYTPDIVYDAIVEWVAKEYGLNRRDFVRPFYPGGDYQNFKYLPGSVVVDNPPFSILAQIIQWYTEHCIKFFLFAPTLTLFSSSSSACCLPCGGKITYENGATVPTSFVTNLEELRVRVEPVLYKLINAANEENQKQYKKTLPKYKYPDNVLTSAMCRYMCEHDTAFILEKKDSQHIRQLDSQKEYDDSAIFGSGFLLSEKAAAEKAAAEKAAAEKAAAEKAAAHIWELSERERDIIKSLGR